MENDSVTLNVKLKVEAQSSWRGSRAPDLGMSLTALFYFNTDILHSAHGTCSVCLGHIIIVACTRGCSTRRPSLLLNDRRENSISSTKLWLISSLILLLSLFVSVSFSSRQQPGVRAQGPAQRAGVSEAGGRWND